MTTQTQDAPFRLHPTASPLRVAARLTVLAALSAALAGGFVSGLSMPTTAASGQVAATAHACGISAC